jgi:hypothetical protein
MEQQTKMNVILATINPAAIPALRIAGTFFLLVNIAGAVYIFRNRHRLFDRNPNVTNDVRAVRQLTFLVIVIPWFLLTTRLTWLLVDLWLA